MRKNLWTVIASAVVLVAMVVVLCFVPTGFVSRYPAPSIDLLSTESGQSVVSLKGAAPPTGGGTVVAAVMGVTSQDKSLALGEMVLGALLPYRDTLPRNTVYPSGQTEKDVPSTTLAQADAIQTSATVAALRQAGIQVTQMPKVAAVHSSSPAYNQVRIGDLIADVNGQSVATAEDLTAAVRSFTVGTLIVLTVVRDGTPTPVTINLMGSATDGRIPTTGITAIDSFFYTPAITVGLTSAQISDSLGLSLALAVYSLVSPDDIIRGRAVSGVGTITPDGDLGPVQGVNELIESAARGGASIVFIAQESCADLGGRAYSDTAVVPAMDFGQVVSLLQSPDGTDLPHC